MSILLMLLGACATTGDPHTGGIFWSPKKARARADGFQQENIAAQQQVVEEHQRQEDLQRDRANLQAHSAHLQAEVEQLLAENARLTAELQQTAQKQHLGKAQLEHLKAVLARNDTFHFDIQPPSAAKSAAIGKQNDELHEEIKQLLGR